MFFLELNPLVKPEIGLVFWSTIAFLLLLFVLGKFAWKPIMKAINEREKGIADSIATAEKVKLEMAQLKSDNEALLAKANEERAAMLKEAKEIKDKIISDAKEEAKAQAAKIVADANTSINHQKNAAMIDLKNQVGKLVIEVSEKILRKELSDKAAQENYIKDLANDVKLN
ncbi:MAG TPA: F0F1 ATP synthase subunit B [Ferruginibacter sp.]|nr:F0F1 ATP synthase subunit B [Ferruginibacter sp.]HRE63689.1 F0F1 ATP synthase subunit B [Ferruginibacter sp.]